MTDPSKAQVVPPVTARPAPRLDEVRRLIGRYSRIETPRSRRARRALLAAPERQRPN
jgi:hypothetical protein